jgi:hypothetical protein
MTKAYEMTRELVIHSATKEWDGSKLAQSLCDRRAYIDDALRQAGLPLTGKAERRRIAAHQEDDPSERSRAIAAAVKEYQAADERLRRAWKIADVVNGTLFGAGMEPLSDEEREALDAGRVPGM